jgi:formate hydrogenlyase subunit 3/multisubunit Na+/H+ antiporter MnhD subunit
MDFEIGELTLAPIGDGAQWIVTIPDLVLTATAAASGIAYVEQASPAPAAGELPHGTDFLHGVIDPLGAVFLLVVLFVMVVLLVRRIAHRRRSCVRTRGP